MRKLIISSLALLLTIFSFSQETKKDTLKTEVISVIKPYTPTISDAFKVTSNPTIEDANTIEKEKVTYSIFSIPVASTFTPSKGKAKGVVREPKDRLFQNYISAGFGNFTSPLFEAYIHSGDTRYNDFGIFINHHSSEGGINDVILNTNFSDTRIDGYYKQFDRDYNWQVNAGVQRKQFNYYGISSDLIFEDAVINSIDEELIYKKSYLGGKIALEDSFLKSATAEIVNFSDDYNSNEVRLLIKPTIEFPISTELINADFLVDLTSGKFNQNYITTDDIKYSFLNLGFNPNFEVLRENLTVNLGAKLYYTNDLENKVTNFYAYPNVTASLKMIDEVLTLVAGVTGDLDQNTYANFANKNPYVSPTLNILQTDKQYKAFAGAKGKLASNIGYNFNVSHTSEINKPLFIQNQTKTDGTIFIENAYEAGNSFNVVYDNIKTLSVFGEITIDASDEFDFGASINYSNFTTENELEAWNLPTITATISADYQNKKWFAGVKLFYNGETKDFVIPYGLNSENGMITKNKSYMDLNLNGGYVFSDRLTAFAKINNALGEKYFTFVNYEVQPLQILAGITYKFDL
ncbi:MAG: TonB-dependent receptor [Lutibacter sp.]|uniref:TonB-dependent receptor n=1 Tax=Lutibacter sp. TaxID=1925666 RepID=UPI0017CFD485|nr:TonB-dependent receptor [Lutibacter sp.]MBT8318251.1 TonB-dependent receptor [Lutibacter sp.]NNJ59110.1 TonB-dependent receptor [Lutibacter sp.]